MGHCKQVEREYNRDMQMGWMCEAEDTCMMDAECPFHKRCWMVENEDYSADLAESGFPVRPGSEVAEVRSPSLHGNASTGLV